MALYAYTVYMTVTNNMYDYFYHESTDCQRIWIVKECDVSGSMNVTFVTIHGQHTL